VQADIVSHETTDSHSNIDREACLDEVLGGQKTWLE
jgi:hypothetical protein